MISRRNFLKLTALGLVGGSAAWALPAGSAWNHPIELTQQPVIIPGLPNAFEHYRLGFLSDLHLGPFLPVAAMTEAFRLLSAARPDMILLGGDYLQVPDSYSSILFSYGCNPQLVGLDSKALLDWIFDQIRRALPLLTAPDGCYGVYGNHDRWWAPALCRRSFQEAGVRLLVNEKIRIQRGRASLELMGFDDLWTGRPQLKSLNAQPGPDSVRILLAHNPDFYSQLWRQGAVTFALGLAGHTHGGQIRLPNGYAPVANIADRRLLAGLYEGKQGQVFTTRGIGTVGLPLRLNCPPEVVLLELRSA